MTFCISVLACHGQQPQVLIRDFVDVRAATDYALQEWPTAVLVDVKPVHVINLPTECH